MGYHAESDLASTLLNTSIRRHSTCGGGDDDNKDDDEEQTLRCGLYSLFLDAGRVKSAKTLNLRVKAEVQLPFMRREREKVSVLKKHLD